MSALNKYSEFLLSFRPGLCTDLPVISPIAIALADRIRVGHIASEDEVRCAVMSDAFLAAKSLGIANSICRDGNAEILSVREALGRISVDYLSRLVAESGRFPCEFEVEVNNLWRHQCAVVMAVELLRTYCPDGDVPFDACLTAAILHDIGYLIEGQYSAARLRELGDVYRPQRTESQRHAKLGESLAIHWFFPPLIAEAIRYHHEPFAAPSAHGRFVATVIALADSCANGVVENLEYPQSVRGFGESIGLGVHATNRWLEALQGACGGYAAKGNRISLAQPEAR